MCAQKSVESGIHMTTDKINYVRWKRVILNAQLVTAGLIFLTEIFGNFMLYVTRSQGYGPDTIVEKLLRYLVLTTVINFGTIALGQLIIRNNENTVLQKYVLIIGTAILCTNAAVSHYQFTIVYGVFVIPVVLSILYEDRILSMWALGTGVAGLGVSVAARAMDAEYNKDVAIEGAAAYIFLFSIFIISGICMDTMSKRRTELGEALLGAEKARYLEKIGQMSLQMVETLANAIDAKDRYTKGHSFRVAEYSAIIAKELGWPRERVDILRYEALLHDVGKIGIPDTVLNKDGKLTEVEFNVIRSHTTIGADILKDVTTLPGAKLVAKSHHERYDGKGYPTGVEGQEIPVNARIVGLADAYDAMNSERIYRAALAPEVIREELVKGRGTQFDPELLDLFLQLLDQGRLQIRTPFEFSGKKPRELPENLVIDLKTYIAEVAKRGEYQGAMTVEYEDFSKIYSYLKKLGERYDHSLEVVMVVLTPNLSEHVSTEEIDTASHSMEFAIQKNIRTVDICIRCSKMQYLTVMLDAGMENVDAIMQRIFVDYYKLCGNRKVEPSYQVN